MSYGTLWVIMSLRLLFSFIPSRIMFHRGTISRAPFVLYLSINFVLKSTQKYVFEIWGF